MDKEFKILELADYYEKFEVNRSSAYLIINKNMKDYECLFGFVELSDNFDDARQLFEAVEAKAVELGCKTLVGPVNFCSWMSYRWAISRFDMKLYPDCTNPPYYNDFIEKLGYEILYTYRSAVVDMNNPVNFMGEELYNDKVVEGFEFRFLEGDEVYDYVEEIFDISKDAFAGSALYCDIPVEYFRELYLSWTRDVRMIMYIAYYGNEAVGYVMGYKSPYDDCFISKTSAVRKSYQNNKLYPVLLYLGCRHVKDMGYDNMFYHFQCEQKKTFKRFDETIESNEKRYAVYIKELEI